MIEFLKLFILSFSITLLLYNNLRKKKNNETRNNKWILVFNNPKEKWRILGNSNFCIVKYLLYRVKANHVTLTKFLWKFDLLNFPQTVVYIDTHSHKSGLYLKTSLCLEYLILINLFFVSLYNCFIVNFSFFSFSKICFLNWC